MELIIKNKQKIFFQTNNVRTLDFIYNDTEILNFINVNNIPIIFYDNDGNKYLISILEDNIIKIEENKTNKFYYVLYDDFYLLPDLILKYLKNEIPNTNNIIEIDFNKYFLLTASIKDLETKKKREKELLLIKKKQEDIKRYLNVINKILNSYNIEVYFNNDIDWFNDNYIKIEFRKNHGDIKFNEDELYLIDNILNISENVLKNRFLDYYKGNEENIEIFLNYKKIVSNNSKFSQYIKEGIFDWEKYIKERI